MIRSLMSKRLFLVAGLLVSLTAPHFANADDGQKKVKGKAKVTKVKDQPATKKDETKESAEPDKVLYERAMASVKKSHYTEARLDLQTLVNTYPDSEYLAKAKLGVADSFYKEGGTSSLTQAVEEYKNFIVFFPFLDEAAYAQMQVGMAHYKLMEKADRDNSHALAAEDEFRTFLLKYPQSPYVPQAEQSMRNVQEVLAQGEFGIAHFYYMKKDFKASAARLVEVTNRYPLFSNSDDALWMLGDIYERARQIVKNEDEKNHWGDLAAKCYDRIITDYPASNLIASAKERLKAMNMPIPAPNPDAVARMKQQQLYEKEHRQLALLKLPMNMVKGSPDVSAAARTGAPNLAPPDDLVSAMDVLTPGAAGPSFNIRQVGSSSGESGGTNGAGTADSESVQTDEAPAPPATPSATPAAQAIDAPGTANSAPAAVDPGANSQPATNSEPAAVPPADAAPAPATASSATSNGSTAATTGSSTPQAAPSNTSTGSSSSPQAPASKSDPSTESSSKKKKGLHKIIPF